MQFLKKKGIPLILTFIFGGCANTPTIQNNNTMESSNSSSTSNCKIYPYKSGILKFKNYYNDSIIWDDWGRKSYETHNNEAIISDNGTEYKIRHSSKQIMKSRGLILDYLIVANKDLRAYYVDNEALDAIVKGKQTETIAGLTCNIWVDKLPYPSKRYCLYKDLILLKKELYSSETKKWKVERVATVAKFNTPIKSSLFTKLPSYPIRNFDKGRSNEEEHTLMRNDSYVYKDALEVAEKIKQRGINHREKIQSYQHHNKDLIERYNNDPVGSIVKKRPQIKFIKDNLEILKQEIAQGNGAKLNALSKFYPVTNLSAWKVLLQKNYRKIFAHTTNSKTKYIENIDDIIFRFTIFDPSQYSSPADSSEGVVVTPIYSN